MRRFWPDSIHSRFTALLVTSLLFCNLAAALLLAREGTAFDKAVRVQNDMGRLVSLVSVLEETDLATGAAILAKTSTAYTRFSIDPAPINAALRFREGVVAETILSELPGHDIRVIERGDEEGDRSIDNYLVVISVKLNSGPHAEEWLNSLVYPLGTSTVWNNKWTFFVPLLASLAAALAVGLKLLNDMTQPLKHLAKASIAAGRGDHTATVAETGPREVREAATAFNTMQRQISDFSAKRRRLVASIGHDLRTPITSLRLRAEMIDDEALRAPMIRTLEEMAVMTEDLLEFGRDDALGEQPLRCDLNAYLADYCSTMDLRFQGTSETPTLLRPVLFRRAIRNLVENAQRYGSKPKIRLSRIGSTAQIQISDDGPGIPEAQLDTVLEPFVRGETSRNTQTGGIGLGLSIVQSIVLSHAGQLQLRNGAQGGLIATITLPLA